MSRETPVRPFVARSSAFVAPSKQARFSLLSPFVHGRPRAPRAEPELPSIDEFLDRTPPIEQFAPSIGAGQSGEGDWPSWGGGGGATTTPAAPSSDGWARDDWQGYDWGSASRLGNAPNDAAAEAWASTDWAQPAGNRQARQSAAEALAQALDQIARRIRAGELRVPDPQTVQEDAAAAATLASMLGIKR